MINEYLIRRKKVKMIWSTYYQSIFQIIFGKYFSCKY